MKSQRIINILLFVLLLGCSKEHSLNNTPKQLWKTANTHDVFASTNEPFIYKDIVLYSWNTLYPEKHKPIIAYNKHTGEKVWEWDDYIDLSDKLYRGLPEYVYDGIYVFGYGGNLYAINLETGETLWKKTVNESGGRSVTGLGETIFYVHTNSTNGEDWLHNQYAIKQINIHTGEGINVYDNEQENENLLPDIRNPFPKVLSNGDTVLVFPINLYNQSTNISNASILLYNISTNNVLWEIFVEDQLPVGAYAPPTINNNKVYIGGQNFYCLDIDTGEILWQKNLTGGTSSAGYAIGDGKVFVGTEGFTPTIYALDATTGQQQWSIDAKGANSKVVYHNEVLYFEGSTYLHAVNTNTGELIWEFESPDVKENSGAFFDDVVTIDEETGRIYVANYLYALCYESIE